MVQFLIDSKGVRDGRIALDGSEAKHARDVFRLKEGEEIQLFDGKGNGFSGVIESVSKKALGIRILKEKPQLQSSPIHVTLAQSVIKHDPMDNIIHKATELNVDCIIPMMTDRCNVKLDAKRREHKREGWQQVMVVACKQCDRLVIPQVNSIQNLKQIIPTVKDYDLVLVAEPIYTDKDLKACLEAHKDAKKILVMVGPEGGFTEEEIQLLAAEGAEIVSLGEVFLKSDTASAHVLSILRYVYS